MIFPKLLKILPLFVTNSQFFIQELVEIMSGPMSDVKAFFEHELNELRAEFDRWNEEHRVHPEWRPEGLVKICVGGRTFPVKTANLQKFPNSLLCDMISGRICPPKLN